MELPKDIEAYVRANGFQIVAVGNPDNDDSPDVWVINEKKELKNPYDDAKGHERIDERFEIDE